MTDRSRTTGDDGSRTTGDGRAAAATGASTDGVRRREFVALGAGASATLLAGCAGDASLPSSDGSDGSDGSDDSDGSQTLTGNFRLLISDAPADIGDFDRLDVTLDRARVFEAGDGDDGDDDEDDDEADEADEADDDTDQNATETDDDDDSLNGTAAEGDDANETDVDDGGDDEEDVETEDGDDEDDDDEEDEDGEDRGFTVVELDGATVDLTQVIDEDAIAVFDGEIPAGSYEKIELEVSAVEGVVDGEAVDVKLPSEKLQITNGFEVTPDEEVSFVFDINVVKRGKKNGYILKPVISGSGVAGRDVDVNEIDDDDDEDEESEDGEADEDDSDDGDDDAETTNDDPEEDDATGGNETDDAGNGTETES